MIFFLIQPELNIDYKKKILIQFYEVLLMMLSNFAIYTMGHDRVLKY